MGAKFGWMLGYNFSLADVVHRIVAVLFTIWAFLAVIFGVASILKRPSAKTPWLPVGSKGFARFTFFTTLLLVFSGLLLWFHTAVPYMFAALGFATHEIVAILALAGVVWHIYDKRHMLQDLVKRRR